MGISELIDNDLLVVPSLTTFEELCETYNRDDEKQKAEMDSLLRKEMKQFKKIMENPSGAAARGRLTFDDLCEWEERYFQLRPVPPELAELYSREASILMLCSCFDNSRKHVLPYIVMAGCVLRPDACRGQMHSEAGCMLRPDVCRGRMCAEAGCMPGACVRVCKVCNHSMTYTMKVKGYSWLPAGTDIRRIGQNNAPRGRPSKPAGCYGSHASQAAAAVPPAGTSRARSPEPSLASLRQAKKRRVAVTADGTPTKAKKRLARRRGKEGS